MPSAGCPSADRLGHQLVEPGRAVEHRELGVDVEVGERIPHVAHYLLCGRGSNLHGCDSLRLYIGCASTVSSRSAARYRYVPGRSATSIGSAGRDLSPAGPAGHRARWQLAHLLELLAGGDLLGEQRGLDAVEQALEPADELGLGDPQLALGRDLAVLERQGQRCAARPAGRATAPRTARRSSARRSRPAAPGWARRAAPVRTSSSSCLTIEPMRITLAGAVTVSVGRVLGALAAGRRLAVARRSRLVVLRSTSGAPW